MYVLTLCGFILQTSVDLQLKYQKPAGKSGGGGGGASSGGGGADAVDGGDGGEGDEGDEDEDDEDIPEGKIVKIMCVHPRLYVCVSDSVCMVVC